MYTYLTRDLICKYLMKTCTNKYVVCTCLIVLLKKYLFTEVIDNLIYGMKSHVYVYMFSV